MLGIREPEIYGHRTYDDLVDYITESVRALGAEATVVQSNYEGEIVTAIQSAYGKYDGIHHKSRGVHAYKHRNTRCGKGSGTADRGGASVRCEFTRGVPPRKAMSE